LGFGWEGGWFGATFGGGSSEDKLNNSCHVLTQL
jgi:hypothetical protein